MWSVPALSAAQAMTLHGLLEWSGMALGAYLWRRSLRHDRPRAAARPVGMGLVVGLLLGAAIGNKLVFFIERPDLWLAFWREGQPLVMGQSIVGGLLGGLLGIELAKRLSGHTDSTGDRMVTPLVIGIAVGRIGCLLAGLHDDTYGLPTALPWAVDLGDGIARHPSPLYEILFLGLLGGLLHRASARLAAVPGLRFKLFLWAYLLWRLLGDGLKPVRVEYPLGLSGIQWVCLAALVLYTPLLLRAAGQLRGAAGLATPSTPEPTGGRPCS